MAETKSINALKGITDQIKTLPTLPAIVSHINQLMQNPRTSAEEVGRAIMTDQAISSRVLKLVNSAFYGFPGRIGTITHAVVILGFSTVKNIVLTTSILKVMGKNQKHSGMDMEEFWFHSIATGAIARLMAKKLNYEWAEEAFLGGILHDLGKLVLYQFAPEEFAKVAEVRDKNGGLLFDAEKSVLSLSHQELGVWLSEKWNLPADLTTVMGYHHRPSLSGNHLKLVQLIHVADILTRAMQWGSGGDDSIPIIDAQAWEATGILKRHLDEFLGECEEEVEKAGIYMQVL